MAVHVFEEAEEISGDNLCEDTLIDPELHFHPKMVVFLGHITVFAGDNVKLFCCILCKNRDQLTKSSCIELPQTCKSSAIIITIPFCNKSPITLDINSFKCSDEPGIPIAERKYTRIPLNGVIVPKYGIEDLDTGIWKKL